MLKIFAAVLVATSLWAGAATARGGGGAEPMPATNYTDMPSYHPCPSKPVKRLKHMRNRDRRHHYGFARDC